MLSGILKINPMKKLTLSLLTLILSLTFVPSGIKAEINKLSANQATNTTERTEAKVLLTRLEIIRDMDKSKMSASEKKNLRREVRSIKKQLKAVGGGIYLSAGAVIIIILLLIILL